MQWKLLCFSLSPPFCILKRRVVGSSWVASPSPNILSTFECGDSFWANLVAFKKALTSAKPNNDKKQDSDSAEVESQFQKLAQQVNDKYHITFLLDIIKMGEKIKEKCPNIEEKLDSVGEEIQNCIEEIEIGSDTFCSVIKNNFVKCYKPAGVLISSCMPEESKDLPFMMGKMINAFIAQSCQATVEEILELFNPCIHAKDPVTLPACQEIKTSIDQHKNKLPSKSLICQTLPKMKNCAKAMVEGSCKNQVTKNAALKFHDAIEHSVKEECDALNKA